MDDILIYYFMIFTNYKIFFNLFYFIILNDNYFVIINLKYLEFFIFLCFVHLK